MKSFVFRDLTVEDIRRLCRRPRQDFDSVIEQIKPIIDDVKNNGDRAVQKWTEKFDGIRPDPVAVAPSDCMADLPEEQKQAIDLAMQNVHRFHREQASMNLDVETMPGIHCMKVVKPVERVGLYVPGGSAPLPSTAIMLGVPALTAGCKTIIMATPPDRDGRIPASICYIARKIGAKQIVKAGGAQAIAAMAFGTESVSKVDKLFGPGNQYVTAAKMTLQNSDAMVAIDLPAGPSELLVIADRDADPSVVAADLLSQAEHGSDSQVILVAVNGLDSEQVINELNDQLVQLPRSAIARKAVENSFILQVDSVDDALSFSNQYAPEHLILNCNDADSYIGKIDNAGSVFLGEWTPESLGDYASGTNHTLPTYGYARMYSGVSLQSFQKSITLQKASKEGLQNLGETVEILASMEGLDAHARAVSIRLEKIKSDTE